jgi:hypothetical protein
MNTNILAAKPHVLKNQSRLIALFMLSVVLFAIASTAHSVDMTNLPGIGGPLASTFVILGNLGPGFKALVAFLGFIVAAITLIAMRSFSSLLFYIGLLIFLAVGLTVAGAMIGAMV